MAHLGGFVGGYLAGLMLRTPERGVHGLLAAGTLGLTAVSFGLALWTGLIR